MRLAWGRLFLVPIASLVLLGLGGCGLQNSSGGPQEIRVEISPGDVALRPGESVTFTARVIGASDTRVEWQATGGRLQAQGNTAVFTMPVVFGELTPYEVTAISVQDPSKKAVARVVWKADPGRVVVEPEGVFLAPGDSVRLRARVVGPDGREVSGARVVWQLSNPGAFRITPDGVLTATGRVGDSTLVMATYGDFVAGFSTAAIGSLQSGVKRLSGSQIVRLEGPSGDPFTQPFVMELVPGATELNPGDRVFVGDAGGWMGFRVEEVERTGTSYRVRGVLLPLEAVVEQVRVEVRPEGNFRTQMLRSQREYAQAQLRALYEGEGQGTASPLSNWFCTQIDRGDSNVEVSGPLLEFLLDAVVGGVVEINIFNLDSSVVSLYVEGGLTVLRGSHFLRFKFLRDVTVYPFCSFRKLLPPMWFQLGAFAGSVIPQFNLELEARFGLFSSQEIYLAYFDQDWEVIWMKAGFEFKKVDRDWRLEPIFERRLPGQPRILPVYIADDRLSLRATFMGKAYVSFWLEGRVGVPGLSISLEKVPMMDFVLADANAGFDYSGALVSDPRYADVEYRGVDFFAGLSSYFTVEPLFLYGSNKLRPLLKFIGAEGLRLVDINLVLLRLDWLDWRMNGFPRDGVGVYLGHASSGPEQTPSPIEVAPGGELSLKVWVRPRDNGLLRADDNLKRLLGLGATYEVYVLGEGGPAYGVGGRPPVKLGEVRVGLDGEGTLQTRVPQNLPPGEYLIRAFGVGLGIVPQYAYTSNPVTLRVGGGSFTLSLNPSELQVMPGSSVQTTLTLTPQGGFTGTVSLSLVAGQDGVPQGLTLSPPSVQVSGTDPVNQPLTLSAQAGTPAGTYRLKVRATSGNLTREADLTVTVSAPGGGGGGAGTTWTVRQTGESLYDVTYGDGLFVAAGGGGSILTSLDGVSWRPQASGISTDLHGVAYGEGLFVAVGLDGTILTSPDGVSWRPQASGTSTDLYGVAYGGGLFVAVGGRGTILTSPDGVSWTPQASGTDLWLLRVTYGNGRFVAVGGEGVVLTSSDGVTWTQRVLGTWLHGVVYGNGTFVAVGGWQTVFTSPDGVSWTKRTSLTWNPSGKISQLRGIAYGNGLFVAVGDEGSIFTSTDGVSWTRQVSGSGVRFRGVTYGNGTFVAVGDDGAGVIFTSSDGVTWTRWATGTNAWLLDVTYGNGLFVAVGVDGTILTSSDGVTWTQRASGTGIELYSVVYGEDLFVVVGSQGTILTSSDGVTWTRRASGTWLWLFDVAYGDGTFVVAGDYGTILTSSDGVNWVAQTSNVNDLALYTVTYGNGTFVVLGRLGILLTSPDGVTWTRRDLGIGFNFHGSAYGDGTFVAVGALGTVLTSQDGVSWTRQDLKTAALLSNVTYADGRFVVVGEGSTILTSP